MKVALVLNQLRDGDVLDHMVSLELAAIMRGCQERLASVQPNWLRRTLAIASRYRRNLCQTAMRNAAAARQARAIGAPALRSAACFPRASAGRALGPLPCARMPSLSSAHARSSNCGVRGNSSSWRSPPSTMDWSLVRSLRSCRDCHHKNALYHGWNGLPYSTAGVPAE